MFTADVYQRLDWSRNLMKIVKVHSLTAAVQWCNSLGHVLMRLEHEKVQSPMMWT